MAMGINAFVGIAKENSWGTGVAATDYLPLTRTTLNRRQEYVSRNELLGNWASPNRELATAYGEGEVEFLARPNVWGHFLRSMFGPPATTTVASHASGITYQHVFVQIDSAYSDDVHFWPYTLELYRDSGSSRRFVGAIANQMTFRAQAGPSNPFVSATVAVVAKDVQSLAASTANPSFETYGPYKAWQATLTKDGGASAIFEELEMTVANNAERVYTLQATQFPAFMQRNNYQDIEVTGRMTFTSEAEYEKFVQNSTGPFQVTFTQSDATLISSGYYPQLDVIVPQLHYTAFAVDIGGPARLTASFTGHARYHATSLTAVRFALRNERASY